MPLQMAARIGARMKEYAQNGRITRYAVAHQMGGYVQVNVGLLQFEQSGAGILLMVTLRFDHGIGNDKTGGYRLFGGERAVTGPNRYRLSGLNDGESIDGQNGVLVDAARFGGGGRILDDIGRREGDRTLRLSRRMFEEESTVRLFKVDFDRVYKSCNAEECK